MPGEHDTLKTQHGKLVEEHETPAVLQRGTFNSGWRSSLSTASEAAALISFAVVTAMVGDAACTTHELGVISFLKLSGGALQYLTVKLLLR